MTAAGTCCTASRIVAWKPGAHLTDLRHPWRRIPAHANLEDVKVHDLRHSFASRALGLGDGLPMIDKVPGHTQVQTTPRYTHFAHGTRIASATRGGDSMSRSR